MATQQERRIRTRHAVLGAARDLFVEQGIEATTTEDVRRAAGVSRGAIYHHFATRDDLITAVYEQVAAEAVERAVRSAAPEGTAIERLVAGATAWLDEALAPGVARILVHDGPAALGVQRCRTIEEPYSLHHLRAGLSAAVEAGEIEVRSVDMAARMLSAVLIESVLLIDSARDTRRVRSEARELIAAFLRGMGRAGPPPREKARRPPSEPTSG